MAIHGRIQIKMEAYDHDILDDAAKKIASACIETGATICGPIPLPTKRETITVNRSPHVDKKSRDQYEIRTHKRLMYIEESNAKTMENLGRISLPAGVEIRFIDKSKRV
ncbi:MAG: 30S ribosomal protein S10 [Planctomycetes bacterium]|nr:30S ribosomal protein S10 [Planctomycetota bacterium]